MAFVQQQQQRASLFYLVFCLVLAIVAASLRGQDDTLRERVTNPTIRDDIRGKTLKELGVVASTTTATIEQQHQQQGRRNTQEQLTFNYFSVSKRKIMRTTSIRHSRSSLSLYMKRGFNIFRRMDGWYGGGRKV
jgi:hypothetical protein